ncbi:MAG: urea transporter [Oceanospirillaceae bacterium]
MIDRLSPLLRGFGQLIFMPHAGVGVLALFAILINSPSMLIAGFVGGLGGTLVGQCVMENKSYQQGLAGFNGVLLGLAAAILIQPSALLWLSIFLGGAISAYCFNWGMKRNLQLLTTPYICVMLLIWWLLPALAQPDGGYQLHWSNAYFVSAIITGIGQMGFQGNLISGAFLLAGLYLGGGWRAMSWALTGSLCGTLLGFIAGIDQHTMAVGFAGYNGALIAVALTVGPGHRVTSWQPWLGIVVAVLLTLLGLHLALIPVLTIPFVLAMWVVIALERLKARGRKTK